MLAEADHTRSPEEILDSAWRYQDQLQKLFGPWYGQGPPTGAYPDTDVGLQQWRL